MAQSLRQIKNRIKSVENTQKVTSAMQMISVAKLNHIDKKLFLARPYFVRLESFLYDLLAGVEENNSVFLRKKQTLAPVVLCIITSDTGLCGNYNHNIIKFAEDFIKKIGLSNINLVLIGQKGFRYFKNKNVTILKSYLGLNGKYSKEVADEINNYLVDLFLNDLAREVHIIYTHFENALVYKPKVDKFLNLEAKEQKKIDYIAEPDINLILEEIIKKYITMKMRLVMLEAFTSEHASRTVSMKSATDNADELLDSLVTLRNKVRQAGITQEIMEIISSVEALKG